MIPVIDREKCTGCGECIEECPPQAITLDEKRAAINPDLCEECGECVPACPEKAISIPWE